MVDYPLLLHNDSLAEFHNQMFSSVLNLNHLTDDGIVHYHKGRLTTGEEMEINFWGWVAIKDGINYLIPREDSEGNEHDINDILPIVPKKWDTVSFKNKSYRLIRSFTSVSFKKENRLGMRALVDALASTPHTNPSHRKLLVLAVLSQVCSRAYYRFSSKPGQGKDSAIDLFGALVGDCITLENPSIAKLERHAATMRVTGLNEVVGLTKSQWQDISKFMLAACAFKSKISKRTLAHGVVGEEIDLRNYSISVLYNDVNHYPGKNIIYFDDLAEKGILDRLPAMRLRGQFTYDFNKIEEVDVPEFVSQHMDAYKDLIYTILYYRDNPPLKKYDYVFKSVSARWKRSLGVLQTFIGEYCESEKEFLDWMKVVEDAMLDYQAMLAYPSLLDACKAKGKFKEHEQKFINDEDSYSNRVKLMSDFLSDKPTEPSKKITQFKAW